MKNHLGHDVDINGIELPGTPSQLLNPSKTPNTLTQYLEEMEKEFDEKRKKLEFSSIVPQGLEEMDSHKIKHFYRTHTLALIEKIAGERVNRLK